MSTNFIACATRSLQAQNRNSNSTLQGAGIERSSNTLPGNDNNDINDQDNTHGSNGAQGPKGPDPLDDGDNDPDNISSAEPRRRFKELRREDNGPAGSCRRSEGPRCEVIGSAEPRRRSKEPRCDTILNNIDIQELVNAIINSSSCSNTSDS